jgi:hypothetical protein
MRQYRIVEDTGIKTEIKCFYLQRKVRKLFGGRKWKNCYQYHPEGHRRLHEFDSLEEGQKYIDRETEFVTRKYH